MPRRTAHWLVAGLLVLHAAAAGAARYPGQPARGDGLVCVSVHGVACVDRESGALRWSALAGEHTLEAVIAGGRVFVAGSGGLRVFRAGTGELEWRWRSGAMVFPPTVAGGVAYTGDETGRMWALDADSGDVLWERRFEGWSYPPALVGDTLVTGGRGGIVRGLDAATGATRWRRAQSQELVYRPIAAGGLAVVTTFDGTVAAYRADGSEAWRHRDPVASRSPAAGGGLLLFGGLDGRLRARDAADGRLLWSRDFGEGRLQRPAVFGPDARRAALHTPDHRIVVLEVRSGRPLLQIDVPPGTRGTPLFLAGRGWTVVVHRAGTFSLVPLSDFETDG
ncbi:MAG: PQQ-binding-like beta-propeller repeat protein [Halofilum sp. (in: g-proteobacteria)]|nr:PQQ-binding-like beta-propeller repeat protein [Halofilum sp. (in: g-proteobacteria)]